MVASVFFCPALLNIFVIALFLLPFNFVLQTANQEVFVDFVGVLTDVIEMVS